MTAVLESHFMVRPLSTVLGVGPSCPWRLVRRAYRGGPSGHRGDSPRTYVVLGGGVVIRAPAGSSKSDGAGDAE